MEARVSEILENILGLMALEGNFEVTEGESEVIVVVEPNDPGRLIGYRGETLDALQLLVNMIVGRQLGQVEFKRVVIDVSGWRKNKEADLERRARDWATAVLEQGKEMELEPMPSWQRRVVHLVISEITGVESESLGEGKDRHLIIKPAVVKEKSSKKRVKSMVES